METPYPRKLDQATAAAGKTPNKRGCIVGRLPVNANDVFASVYGRDLQDFLEQLPPAGDCKVPAPMKMFKKIKKEHPRKPSGHLVSAAIPGKVYDGVEYRKKLAKDNEDKAAAKVKSEEQKASDVDNWICTNETCKAINDDSTARTCMVCGTKMDVVFHQEGWGTLFSNQPKTWQCQACATPNAMDLVACKACTIPRDQVANVVLGGTNSRGGGAPAPSVGSIGPGGFTFQVPTPNKSSIGPTGFAFGGAVGSSSQAVSSLPQSEAPSSGGFTYTAPTGATPAAGTPKVQDPQASEINGKSHQSLTKPTVNGESPSFSFGVAPTEITAKKRSCHHDDTISGPVKRRRLKR